MKRCYLYHTDLRGFSNPRDVADTTSADGNIWKMLLGAVNDWFDDDHDEETDEEDEPRNL